MKLSPTQKKAIGELLEGKMLIHKFYTRSTSWYIDGVKINSATARFLIANKIVVLHRNDFGGITTHYYKINPEYEQTVNRG